MAVKDTLACYLVAADPNWRLTDATIVDDDCGAFLTFLEDGSLASSVVELYHRRTVDRPFDIKVVEAHNLEPHVIALADADVRRISLMPLPDQDPHDNRVRLAAWELHHAANDVLQAQAGKSLGVKLANEFPHIPPGALKEPSNLREAIERLAHALERHLLTFLMMASPRRLGTIIPPIASDEEVCGDNELIADIDVHGGFLFRHRTHLLNKLDYAVSHFGSDGKSGGTEEPAVWLLDRLEAEYVQETARLIDHTIESVSAFGTLGDCKEVVTKSIEVAHPSCNPGLTADTSIDWEYPWANRSLVEHTKREIAAMTPVGNPLTARECERTVPPERGRGGIENEGSDSQMEVKPKRRGRKKAGFETCKREDQVLENWNQARESGVYKADFAKEQELTTKDLDKLLNRVRKRKSRSDK